MKLRNSSDETVRDFLTQQVAGPDETIEVDDELAHFYEDHPVWVELPDHKPSRAKTPDKDEA